MRYQIETIVSGYFKYSLAWIRVTIGILVPIVLFSGCANQPVKHSLSNQRWIDETINYQQTLPEDHPDHIDKLFVINEEMREAVVSRFSKMRMHKAAEGLANWLVSEKGRNMRYDITASLTPIQAFNQRRGNCLSFTILLITLAEELGIEIEFNAVDIPNTWGLDEQLGMVSYRHVNGLLERRGRRQVFDLAMDIYNNGYPQEVISREQALALLHNNKAVEFISEGNNEQAIHALKLAISLSPENTDLWVNMGVVLRRTGKVDLAEVAYKHALDLNPHNASAASNLEIHYRKLGQYAKADVFKKRTEQARRRNPYFYYQKAMQNYRQENYRTALQSTNKAIRLHDRDPRFFELKSLISQQQQNYHSALKSLKKAYSLALDSEQRDKYANKVQMIYQAAIQSLPQQRQRQRERGMHALDQLQR